MVAVLGIDAAWTPHGPSGVALIRRTRDHWRCVAVASSYDLFLNLDPGAAVAIAVARQRTRCRRGVQPDTSGPEHVNTPGTNPFDAARLLRQASRLAQGDSVEVVAMDLPLSYAPITGRRPADNEVARVFAAAGCGTHSPSGLRPGAFGRHLQAGFEAIGFRLATKSPRPAMPPEETLPMGPAQADSAEAAKASTALAAPTTGASDALRMPGYPPTATGHLIEVYPHLALLALLGLRRRLSYKAGRAARYWPGTRVEERRERLIQHYRLILSALAEHIENLPPLLSYADRSRTLASLKPLEDCLDALLCAWVGAKFWDNEAVAYGDADAAIWAPRGVCIPGQSSL